MNCRHHKALLQKPSKALGTAQSSPHEPQPGRVEGEEDGGVERDGEIGGQRRDFGLDASHPLLCLIPSQRLRRRLVPEIVHASQVRLDQPAKEEREAGKECTQT